MSKSRFERTSEECQGIQGERGTVVLSNDIDRDGRANDRVLSRFISLASRVRAPDASRGALKNKAPLGVSPGAWTQAAMRGTSAWSIGEREVMAAMVAKWNGCAFCADVHGAVAAKHMGGAMVDAVLSDYGTAPISKGLKATLAYLEIMTLHPENLTEGDARAVLSSGISAESLTDAIAIGAVFNLIAAYANALKFSIPTAEKLHRIAETLFKVGYRL
jgi:uncharacterized peroxidase-related enzyme